MKRTVVAGICGVMVTLAGAVAPPAGAARPEPPQIQQVAFDWTGPGADNYCAMEITFTIDPAYTKGRRVMLGYTWLSTEGLSGEWHLMAGLQPGQTTVVHAVPVFPDGWPRMGIVATLRHRYNGPDIDTYRLDFPMTYTCPLVTAP